jgi:hypothetical protein
MKPTVKGPIILLKNPRISQSESVYLPFSSSSSPGEKLPFGDSLPLSAEDELPAESPVLA